MHRRERRSPGQPATPANAKVIPSREQEEKKMNRFCIGKEVGESAQLGRWGTPDTSFRARSPHKPVISSLGR